jgi:ATP/maltotriose-dependent transcriptional regulator MalT
MEGDAAILIGDNAPAARELGRQAVEAARAVGNADVEVIGIGLQGIALVTEGSVDEGMRLLDEAAAAALSGEMSDPGYISWAICYLIYACERVRDYDRAVQWCEQLREYGERSGMAVIRGICRVHLAGVYIWRGNWQAAEDELADAWRLLEHRPLPIADGKVRLADLRHRQGRVEESAELFREVEWHPLAQLGLAELALDEGRLRDAKELLDRLLRQVPESSRTQRAEAQELLVRVYALQGNHRGAQEALEVVRELSESVSTLPLKAALRYSAGALAVASKNYDEAVACFEDAAALYQRCGAPYETARARLELAATLVMLDRLERARSEAATALDTLSRLDSTRFAARATALIEEIDRRSGAAPSPATSSLLTERQVEVLRLISRGMNDREIAEALVVSEHTVHRHVANILQRLELPSRAAAVAYASAQGIL